MFTCLFWLYLLLQILSSYLSYGQLSSFSDASYRNTAVHHEMNQVNSLFIFSHVGLWQWWVALLVRLVIAVAQPACPDKLWWHLKVHRGHLSHFPTWQEKNSGWLLKVFSHFIFFSTAVLFLLFCFVCLFPYFLSLKIGQLMLTWDDPNISCQQK